MNAVEEGAVAVEETTNGEVPKSFLSAADIRGREDIRYDEFQVRAWGGAWVRIRSLTSKERDRYEESVTEQKAGKQVANMRNARAKLCVLTLVDGAGNRLFGDKDVEALGGKNSDAINQIFKASCQLSGILQTEKDVEEAVGNSDEIRDDDS